MAFCKWLHLFPIKKEEKEGKNVGAQQSTRVYVKVKIGLHIKSISNRFKYFTLDRETL